MISMTGYTKKDFKIKSNKFSILIKSLNSSKGLDISIKTPRYLIMLEPEIRKLVEKELVRGKISVIIMDNQNSSNLVLDNQKLIGHVKSLKKITPDASSGSILNAVMHLPDIFSSETVTITTIVKKEFLTRILQALQNLTKCRKKEGHSLMKAIKSYINSIVQISKDLVRLEAERVKLKKSKIYNQIKTQNIDHNPSRIESEMIYYFERNDITEERIRLQYHCRFFLEVLKKERVVGRKLNFISQEILREINTIGSKANYFEIQKKVVLMKEQIDKIKEQLQNIL